MSKAATAFTGFPAEAFDFYERLGDNNNKTWWNEHKGEYLAAIKEPLAALLAELEPEFGTPKIYRPYNDTRFAKGKPPIKDHQGGVVEVEDAMGYYVQISGSGLMVAGGWYAPQGDQTARYRESVEGPAGAELERMLKSMKRTWEIDGDPVKTQPRGYTADHPRIDLLRNRRITVARQPQGIHHGA
jgi:uncharacterized protein (TIGR02453 family)